LEKFLAVDYNYLENQDGLANHRSGRKILTGIALEQRRSLKNDRKAEINPQA
jgi:hypothetical protein